MVVAVQATLDAGAVEPGPVTCSGGATEAGGDAVPESPQPARSAATPSPSMHASTRPVRLTGVGPTRGSRRRSPRPAGARRAATRRLARRRPSGAPDGA